MKLRNHRTINFRRVRIHLTFLIMGWLFSTLSIMGQVVSGKITDKNTGEPLEYVCVGVINTTLGIYTDKEGLFKLDVTGQPSTAEIRISMISYISQTFTINELDGTEHLIKLNAAPTQLSEVIVRPGGKLKNVGQTSYSRLGNWCGWGGQHNKGCEVGKELSLGDNYIKVMAFHAHLYRQAFDSSLFRLHIRSISENKPKDELLTENILIPVKIESGWIIVDLSKYNIVLKGEIAISLEWVKTYHAIEDRSKKIKDRIQNEYVLFSTTRKGTIYTLWGIEAPWKTYDEHSPAMYLTVKKLN